MVQDTDPMARIRLPLVVLVLGLSLWSAAAGQEAEVTYPWELVPADALRGHLMQGAFVEPGGLFFDAKAGELILADTKNGLIGIFNAEGTPLFAFGRRPLLIDPRVVSVGADGTIYVLDADQTVIKRFSYRGEPLEPFRPVAPEEEGETTPVRVSTFSVDDRGRLYVGDVAVPRLLIYEADGMLATVVRPKKRKIRFQIISGIAISAGGLVAVTDLKATPIQIFDRQGGFVTGFGGRDIALEDFSAPVAVAFDEKGYLYAVDMLRHNVKIFDREGTFQGAFGGWFGPESGGRAPGEMLYPTGIAVAPGGMVYVSERFGNRVQLFRRLLKGGRERPRLRLPDLSGGEAAESGGSGGGAGPRR